MTDQIKELRGKVLDVLRRNGVLRAAFFGSVVRGEMTEKSNVDILVEFEGRKSLMDLSGLKIKLEVAIDREVDVPVPTLPPSAPERENPERAGPDTMRRDPEVPGAFQLRYLRSCRVKIEDGTENCSLPQKRSSTFGAVQGTARNSCSLLHLISALRTDTGSGCLTSTSPATTTRCGIVLHLGSTH